jgi:hypothetical protein
VVTVQRGARSRVIGRVAAAAEAQLELRAGGKSAGTTVVEAGPWTEVVFEVPPEVAGDRVDLEIIAGAPITAFHWWVALR